MPYTIQVNALINLQIVGRLHGQRTRNTFWYRMTGPAAIADGAASLQALNVNFFTSFGDPLRALVCSEWTCEYVQSQLILPVRYRPVVEVINLPGLVNGSSVPSGVAVVLSRYGNRAGRRWQGRIFVPGLAVQDEADSSVTPAKRAAWTALANTLPNVLVGAVPAEQYSPVVSAEPPFDQDDIVVDTFFDHRLRYQRKRELDVGE